MGRILKPAATLTIEANVSPCAHTCRYCSIGDRSSPIDICRYLTFVERLVEWSRKTRPGLKVLIGFSPSYNHDLETFKLLGVWYRRVFGKDWDVISLGGLKMRSDDDMRRWLAERQEAGLKSIYGTFVGRGAVHDRWNGRRGDFDFLIRTMRIGAELGLDHTNQHIVIKDSLPLLTDVFGILDALPTRHSGRYARLPYYIGHNVHHEDQRIDEDDRSALPAIISDLLDASSLHSERGWIEFVDTQEEAPMEVSLRLELDVANIGLLETKSGDAIVTDLETRASEALSKIPFIQELARTYGDPKSTKIYNFFDVERVWIARFLASHPIPLDQKLLHYHLGRSVRPPRLWKLKSFATGQ